MLAVLLETPPLYREDFESGAEGWIAGSLEASTQRTPNGNSARQRLALATRLAETTSTEQTWMTPSLPEFFYHCCLLLLTYKTRKGVLG